MQKNSNRLAEAPSDGWAFRSKFRRGAFGWRGSKLAIERIQEAHAEIRGVQRRDPVAAARGAVLLLQRLSPALSQIDSSSGALGSATYAAVRTLVPIIASAPRGSTSCSRRCRTMTHPTSNLGRLFWGDLCATEQLASSWADELVPAVRRREAYELYAIEAHQANSRLAKRSEAQGYPPWRSA